MSDPLAGEDALFADLRAAGHLSGALPPADAEHGVSRWILALQAGGGWLAALFMLSFVGLGAAALVKGGVGWLLLGVLTTLAAGGVLHGARSGQSVFLRQFLLPFLLAGQGAFALGAGELLDRQGAWLVAAFELAVCFGIAWPLHRFLAALMVLLALQVAVGLPFERHELFAAWFPVVCWAAGCALSLDEVRWRTLRVAPVLAAFVAALMVYSLAWAALPLVLEGGGFPGAVRLASELARGALVLCAALALVWLGRAFWGSGRGPLLLAMLLAVLALTWRSPGIALGVTAMALGFASGRRWLLWLGGACALAAIGRYYYYLPVSLLDKSGALVLGGLLLLAARQLLPKGANDVA